jgi:hypothetical protein
MIRRIRQSRSNSVSLADFKRIVREQFYMLLLDQKAAVAAIPTMLPDDAQLRAEALDVLKLVLRAAGELAGESKARLGEVIAIFSGESRSEAPPLPSSVTPITRNPQFKAS